MSLTKEQILSANDLVIEEVQVPEWSGSVFVRNMSGLERDSFESDITDTKGKKALLYNIRAKLCARCMCDKAGNFIFESKDIEELGTRSGAALDRVFEVAKRINKIGEDDVNEMEKKLKSNQS